MRPRGGITGLSGIDGHGGGGSPPPVLTPLRIVELDALDHGSSKILNESAAPVSTGENVHSWTETNNSTVWARDTSVGPKWLDTSVIFNDSEDSFLLASTPALFGQEADCTIYFWGIIGATGGHILGNSGGTTAAKLAINSTSGLQLIDSSGFNVFGEELPTTLPTDQLTLVRLRLYVSGPPDLTWSGAGDVYDAVDEGISVATIGLRFLWATATGSDPNQFNPADMMMKSVAIWQWADVTDRTTHEQAYELAHGGEILEV